MEVIDLGMCIADSIIINHFVKSVGEEESCEVALLFDHINPSHNPSMTGKMGFSPNQISSQYKRELIGTVNDKSSGLMGGEKDKKSNHKKHDKFSGEGKAEKIFQFHKPMIAVCQYHKPKG